MGLGQAWQGSRYASFLEPAMWTRDQERGRYSQLQIDWELPCDNIRNSSQDTHGHKDRALEANRIVEEAAKSFLQLTLW